MNSERKRFVNGILLAIIRTIIAVFITILVVNSSIPSRVTNDGWANYIGGIAGSFIGSVTSFFILYINNKDTRKIEEENRKFQEDSMKSKNYSKIVFKEVLTIYRSSESKNCIKFKLNDENGIPLKTIKVDRIHLLGSNERYAKYEEENLNNMIYEGDHTIELEYTPKQIENRLEFEDFYYANLDLNRSIENMLIYKFYKFVIYMETINIFGISIKQKYNLMVECNENGMYAMNDRPKFVPEGSIFVTYLKTFHFFTIYDSIMYKKD